MKFNDIISGKAPLPTEQIRTRAAAANVYFHAKVHIDGVLPNYIDLGREVKRIGSSKEISDICDQRIFCDHPHEPFEARNERRRMLAPILMQTVQGQISRFSSIIFQDGNYEIAFANSTTELYFRLPNFDGKSFHDWAKTTILRLCLTDPNGYLLVIPQDFPTLKNPIVEYLPTPSIIYADDDIIAWAGDGGNIMGMDNENFYSYSTSAPNEVVQYPHRLGVLPAIQLGGVTQVVVDKDMYSSAPIKYKYNDTFFAGFLAFADAVLRTYTQLQYVQKMHAFPVRQEYILTCETCNGSGVIAAACNCDKDPCETCMGTGMTYETCNVCDGRKTIVRSPSDVLRTSMPKGDLPDRDYIRYYQPPQDSLTYLREAYNDEYNKALSALYVQRTDIAQSGLSKQESRKDESTFLSSISSRVFTVLSYVINVATAFVDSTSGTRNGISGVYPKFGGVSVSAPINFDLRNTNDMLKDLDAAMSIGDAATIQTMRDSLLRMVNGGNAIAQRKDLVLTYCDKVGYRNRTTQNKSLLIAGGIITAQDAKYYESIPNICDRLILERGKQWFMTTPLPEIERQIIITYEQANK